jgi:catechol 2,3-dioxygenase-like lactoylglutathione lyase family enzyme
MPLTELNHYFVRSKDLQRSRQFYCDLLGFEQMPRPDFPFPGFWLGVNGKVQVHMGLDGIAEADRFYLGTTAGSARDNAGVVDHIAFQGTDPEGFMQRFHQAGLPSRGRYIDEIELLQIFVTDPDGLTIELNFPGIPARPAWATATVAPAGSSPPPSAKR